MLREASWQLRRVGFRPVDFGGELRAQQQRGGAPVKFLGTGAGEARAGRPGPIHASSESGPPATGTFAREAWPGRIPSGRVRFPDSYPKPAASWPSKLTQACLENRTLFRACCAWLAAIRPRPTLAANAVKGWPHSVRLPLDSFSSSPVTWQFEPQVNDG